MTEVGDLRLSVFLLLVRFVNLGWVRTNTNIVLLHYHILLPSTFYILIFHSSIVLISPFETRKRTC